MSVAIAKNYQDNYTPDVIPSQSGLNRYWDPYLGVKGVKLKPGEFCLSQKNEMLVTVVGSSLALCVRDRRRGLMGISHFMVPKTGFSAMDLGASSLVESYGYYVLDEFLGTFYEQGATPRSLEATIVGGAKIWTLTQQCAEATLDFTRYYLGQAKIRTTGEFVHSPYPCKVRMMAEDYLPNVSVLYDYTDTIGIREMKYLQCLRADWLLGQRKTSMRIGKKAAKKEKTRSVKKYKVWIDD